jgi:hypothetical protein
VIDLKREIERELSLIDPPDLWDRIQAEAANDGDAAVLDLTAVRHRRRPSLWLAVAAVVVVLLALVGTLALLDEHETVDTTPATEVPVVPDPPGTDGALTILARGSDVELVLWGGPGLEQELGQTLNVDAVERDGVVTGEFRVNNLVVTLECADTNFSDGEIRLGGEVTDDPDGQGLAAMGGDVGVGDRVALVIREFGADGQDRVAFYGDDSASSCTELVESIRDYLDNGELTHIAAGDDIETGEGPWNP